MCLHWKSLSGGRLFAIPWTIQSVEFSRPESWSGEPFPSPGDLPNPGIEPRSPALQADSLPAEPPGKPNVSVNQQQKKKLFTTHVVDKFNSLICEELLEINKKKTIHTLPNRKWTKIHPRTQSHGQCAVSQETSTCRGSVSRCDVSVNWEVW